MPLDRRHTRSRAGPVETAQLRWDAGVREIIYPRISYGIAKLRRFPGGNIPFGQLTLDDFPDQASPCSGVTLTPLF